MNQEEQKRKAWAYGLGMASVDGGKPTKAFLEAVEQNIKGELSDEDLQKNIEEGKYLSTYDG